MDHDTVPEKRHSIEADFLFRSLALYDLRPFFIKKNRAVGGCDQAVESEIPSPDLTLLDLDVFVFLDWNWLDRDKFSFFIYFFILCEVRKSFFGSPRETVMLCCQCFLMLAHKNSQFFAKTFQQIVL